MREISHGALFGSDPRKHEAKAQLRPVGLHRQRVQVASVQPDSRSWRNPGGRQVSQDTIRVNMR